MESNDVRCCSLNLTLEYRQTDYIDDINYPGSTIVLEPGDCIYSEKHHIMSLVPSIII